MNADNIDHVCNRVNVNASDLLADCIACATQIVKGRISSLEQIVDDGQLAFYNNALEDLTRVRSTLNILEIPESNHNLLSWATSDNAPYVVFAVRESREIGIS